MDETATTQSTKPTGGREMIELQRLDANCNNCIFMDRNMAKYSDSLEFHRKMQFGYFNVIKQKLIDKASWYKNTFNDLETWDNLLTESENMRFQFNKNEAYINYGNCKKLNKEVSFIPNIIQLDTQECFLHRKDANQTNN